MAPSTRKCPFCAFYVDKQGLSDHIHAFHQNRAAAWTKAQQHRLEEKTRKGKAPAAKAPSTTKKPGPPPKVVTLETEPALAPAVDPVPTPEAAGPGTAA